MRSSAQGSEGSWLGRCPPALLLAAARTPASLTVRSLALSSAALFSSWTSGTPAALLNLAGGTKKDTFGAWHLWGSLAGLWGVWGVLWLGQRKKLQEAPTRPSCGTVEHCDE